MNIDLHLHTNLGSSCSYMGPDQLIEKAKSVGLNGVCLTDHDHIWSEDAIDRLQEKHDFLVIGGSEINTDEGEVLVFGLHQPVLNVYRVEELRSMVDECEGFMILAHPFRYEVPLVAEYQNSNSLTSQELTRSLNLISKRSIFQRVDTLEVINGRSSRLEKKFTALVAEHLHFKGTGGSDAHAVMGVGSCYTVFEEEIRNERDLINQLKEGHYSAVDRRWDD